MDENKLKKECMCIINQLFDLAEVPIEKRQQINDKADNYLLKQFLRLCVVGGNERLFCDCYINYPRNRDKKCYKCGLK